MNVSLLLLLSSAGCRAHCWQCIINIMLLLLFVVRHVVVWLGRFVEYALSMLAELRWWWPTICAHKNASFRPLMRLRESWAHIFRCNDSLFGHRILSSNANHSATFDLNYTMRFGCSGRWFGMKIKWVRCGRKSAVLVLRDSIFELELELEREMERLNKQFDC